MHCQVFSTEVRHYREINMGWAAIVQMVIQGVGSIMTGRAKSKALSEQKEMAQHRERLARMDAEAAQRKADFEQTRQIMRGAAAEGSLKVALGTSGGRTDVGTAFKLVAQNWAEVELDNFLVGLESRALKTRFLVEAEIHHRQAHIYSDAAKYAFIQGHLGSGEAAMGGIGQMGGGQQQPSTTPSNSTSAGFQGSGSQQTTWGHSYQR